MSCDMEEPARETISVIVAKLDSSLMKSRFDEPIIKVALEFTCDPKFPITHKDFNKIVADFVQQIYERALRASWMLTDPLAEAIFLLEHHYNSPAYGPGYVAALMHANDGAEGGVQAVLNGLAEAIMNIERQKYIERVFTWHLHGCSWELQCDIAKLLLEEYQPFIPPQLRRCVPAQLVDEIQSIIQMYVCSDFMIQQISFGGERPLTAEMLVNREIP